MRNILSAESVNLYFVSIYKMIIKKISLIEDIDHLKEHFPTLMEKFQYSKYEILYQREYFLDTHSENSICVECNNRPILLIPLFSKNNEYSFFGNPFEILYSPSAHASQHYEAARLLKSYFTGKKISFYSCPISNPYLISQNHKLRIEKIATINLTLEENDILKSIRSSYRSLINNGKKILIVKTLDCDSIQRSDFNQFKKFHIQVSGRQTRSDETWNLQYQSIIAGTSFLTLAYLNNELVSGNLISYNAKTAYYSISVNNRKLMELKTPIGHYPIISSALYAKSLGVEVFILGIVESPLFNDKEINIGKFKKGFMTDFKDQISYYIE